MIEKVRFLVERYKVDAIHWDETSNGGNDPRFDHHAARVQFFKDLRENFPNVLMAGEGIDEPNLPLYGISQVTYAGLFHALKWHPVYMELFYRYHRQMGHLSTVPPEERDGAWGSGQYPPGTFEWQQRDHEFLGIIPTISIADRDVKIDSDGMKRVFERARSFYRDKLGLARKA